jgi:hypothetical protein
LFENKGEKIRKNEEEKFIKTLGQHLRTIIWLGEGRWQIANRYHFPESPTNLKENLRFIATKVGRQDSMQKKRERERECQYKVRS